jgi:hypothetical protein
VKILLIEDNEETGIALFIIETRQMKFPWTPLQGRPFHTSLPL